MKTVFNKNNVNELYLFCFVSFYKLKIVIHSNRRKIKSRGQLLTSCFSPNFPRSQFALMEEKITLASALRHFEVTTLKDCHPSPEVILKATPGVFVKLTKRFPWIDEYDSQVIARNVFITHDDYQFNTIFLWFFVESYTFWKKFHRFLVIILAFSIHCHYLYIGKTEVLWRTYVKVQKLYLSLTRLLPCTFLCMMSNLILLQLFNNIISI